MSLRKRNKIIASIIAVIVILVITISIIAVHTNKEVLSVKMSNNNLYSVHWEINTHNGTLYYEVDSVHGYHYTRGEFEPLSISEKCNSYTVYTYYVYDDIVKVTYINATDTYDIDMSERWLSTIQG